MGEVYSDSLEVTNMNCIKCANNYYPLRNDINNYDPDNGKYLMCYNEETIMESYFLNKSDILFIWEECYERCAKCTHKGNDDKMACLSCKAHYIEKKFNKSVFLKLHKDNCIIACPSNQFLTYELDCVSSCLDGTHEYMPNSTCLNSCPDNFVVNPENNACRFSSFKNETSISFFNEIIYSNISYFADESNKVLVFSDFKALVTSSKDLDPVKQIKNGISGLYLGNCIKILKIKYNISENEDLIIVEIETTLKQTKDKDLDNSKEQVILGIITKVSIADINGNILNLSYCDNIKVMKYLGNSKDIKVDLAIEYFNKIGIDIFNEKSPFFNDKCKDYDLDIDITLADRRKDIYQNVSFCEDNCVYIGMNYKLLAPVCSCRANILQYYDEKEENEKKEHDEKLSMNNVVKSFTSQLLSFNYDVIKCYNLVFDPKLLKSNKGFFTNIAMIGVQIGILIFFFIKKISSIRVFMINLINVNPPKKKKRYSTINNITNLFNIINGKQNEIKNNDNNNDNINKNSIKLTTEENILNIDLQSPKEIYQMNRKIKEKNKNMPKKIFPKKIENKRLNKRKYKSHIISRYTINENKLMQKIKKKNEKINEQNDILNLGLNIDNEKKYNKKNKIFNISPSKENIFISESFNSERISDSNKEKESEKNKEEEFEKKKLYTPDYEKYNDLNYEDALNYDKRSFSQMFLAFLYQQHAIINTFFAEIFLELRAIKISFFVFGLQINFFLNAFFYTDEYISDTYYNNGILNFFSSLPKSIYSFLVTIIISALLKMLSNSKTQLIEIIEGKDKNPNYLKDMEDELKKLNKKLYIYFFIVFLLGIIFTYYSSAFCAVYKNSQTFWLIGCFESLAMDLFMPFIICFILAGIRYLCIKKKLRILYKINSIIENFL